MNALDIYKLNLKENGNKDRKILININRVVAHRSLCSEAASESNQTDSSSSDYRN